MTAPRSGSPDAAAAFATRTGSTTHRLGWIGVGRMGLPLVTRLLEAGCEVGVYNRTRVKAEALASLGAEVVDTPRELADREIVFSTVSGPPEFISVMLDDETGLLTGPETVPPVLVDCSTISSAASSQVREAAARRGATLMAAPISGNGKHVASGGALFATSGPEAQMALVAPYLRILGRGAHYIGEQDSARLVKIAHNLFLGAVIQSLVETSLLVEAHGISRRAYLEFINDSPMGSAFSAYKAPALVDLDWTPTFTSALLRKDLDLGLAAAEEGGVGLPVTQTVRTQVQAAIEAGHGEDDFASLLAVQAAASGVELDPPKQPGRDGRQPRRA
ncbi:MAG TPA: NAD(P)-dependent oxidoreductase [Solirubrobacteraceae bacterium]|nr:NAD(P)-dependent oxidoreductase [Solirubrobacteraceae bacterium]